MRSLGVGSDGTEQFIGVDPSTQKVILETRYGDVAPILKRNAELRSMGAGNGKDMKLAGSIPLSIIHKWRVEHNVDAFSKDPEQQKAAKRLYNDHQYKLFRIWEGHI